MEEHHGDHGAILQRSPAQWKRVLLRGSHLARRINRRLEKQVLLGLVRRGSWPRCSIRSPD
jgi:hypothetical protein